MITIYTDGACSGNPGRGGWGARIEYADGRIEEIKGGAADTTNNRMELQAAICALDHIAAPSQITIITDSVYVRDGIDRWIDNWKRNGWRTAAKKPVKNKDLWQALDAARTRHTDIKWVWVKGHAGHAGNERADALARQGQEAIARA